MEVERIQMNRYCEEVCNSRDKIRRRGAAKSNTSRDPEDLCWKQDVSFVIQLAIGPVYLKGDFTIIDPSKVFFRNPESVNSMDKLQQDLQSLQKENHWEFLVRYKGHVAYFISSGSWDQDTAFEISRNGTSLGVDELPSRFIAVISKKMVDLFLEENGEGMNLDGGVSVEGVDGQLILSGDGDFVISGSGAASPVRKVSRWIEDECVRNADILCAAGGRWTFCDDSSDEEDEDDEETMKILEEDID